MWLANKVLGMKLAIALYCWLSLSSCCQPLTSAQALNPNQSRAWYTSCALATFSRNIIKRLFYVLSFNFCCCRWWQRVAILIQNCRTLNLVNAGHDTPRVRLQQPKTNYEQVKCYVVSCNICYCGRWQRAAGVTLNSKSLTQSETGHKIPVVPCNSVKRNISKWLVYVLSCNFCCCWRWQRVAGLTENCRTLTLIKFGIETPRVRLQQPNTKHKQVFVLCSFM
jgi:hypothetical protein